eukprot:scaffold2425_cov51-Phaeocystis_antarctica.AAC.4
MKPSGDASVSSVSSEVTTSPGVEGGDGRDGGGGGGNECAARQLDHHVPRHVRALAEQRAKRVPRRSRLGADRPRACGADAVGDGVVRQSIRGVAAVVHGDVGDLGCRAEV